MGIVKYLFVASVPSDVYGIGKSIVNSVRAATVAVYDYTTSLKGFEYNSEEYIQERAKIHSRTAKSLLYLSETNRGIYLKAGQYIGNLERIMPKEYTDVLKVLQDSGPYLPFEEIRIVIDYDKIKLEDLFDSFDKVPIAAASLAQVHKARLRTGEEVAVKIQFPFLRTQHHWDLFMVKQISRVLNKLLEWNDYKGIDLIKNYNTFSKSLIEELNFSQEVRNAEETRENFKDNPNVHIPKNFTEYCSDRLIVQEFVYGIKINDKLGIQKLKLNPLDAANLLVDTFSEMIFKYGHIHCDAHPGNILIRNNPKNRKKPQLILLDHGFYRDLSPEFKMKFSQLWQSLMAFDIETTKQISYELNIGEFYKYLPLIFMFRTMGSRKRLGDPITKEERDYIRSSDLVSFEKINHLMQALPPDMLFVIRASNLVAIHNATLGGTTRHRLLKFTDNAFENIYKGRGFQYYIAKLTFYVRILLFEKFSFLYSKVFKVYQEV